MDNRTWVRYGALGGVWFVVLTVIGGILAGSPPPRSDPAADIVKYYADNDSGLQIGAFLVALGVIGLVWWFGRLWRSNISFGFSSIGDVIMTAAVGGLILRTGFLPKWVGYLSYVVSVLSLAATVGIANDASFLSLFSLLAAAVLAVWIVVIAVLNFQKTAA